MNLFFHPQILSNYRYTPTSGMNLSFHSQILINYRYTPTSGTNLSFHSQTLSNCSYMPTSGMKSHEPLLPPSDPKQVPRFRYIFSNLPGLLCSLFVLLFLYRRKSVRGLHMDFVILNRDVTKFVNFAVDLNFLSRL